MKVEVSYSLYKAPTEDHSRSLRKAAVALTDDKRSVRVEQTERDGHPVLSVTFTMRKVAQYKVIDDIARRFKFDFASFHDYAEFWIDFPREGARRRRRSRS